MGNSAGDSRIFLEAEITPDPAYVQAQMRFVVRLLRAVDVVDGTLTEPSATNAVLLRLGRDISYTTVTPKASVCTGSAELVGSVCPFGIPVPTTPEITFILFLPLEAQI